MTGLRKLLSIITLSINGFNIPIKKHRHAGWIRKLDTTSCCLQETQLSSTFASLQLPFIDIESIYNPIDNVCECLVTGDSH